eukprot:scaffold22069_cov35-Prasinocladus_malaysianus.AAC.2
MIAIAKSCHGFDPAAAPFVLQLNRRGPAQRRHPAPPHGAVLPAGRPPSQQPHFAAAAEIPAGCQGQGRRRVCKVKTGRLERPSWESN